MRFHFDESHTLAFAHCDILVLDLAVADEAQDRAVLAAAEAVPQLILHRNAPVAGDHRVADPRLPPSGSSAESRNWPKCATLAAL